MKRSGAREYPRSLVEIAMMAAQVMVERGQEEAVAMEIGFRAAEGLRRKFGGQSVAFYRGSLVLLSSVDKVVLEAFDGTPGSARRFCAAANGVQVNSALWRLNHGKGGGDYPRSLVEIVKAVALALIECGEDETAAAQAGLLVSERLRHGFKGRHIYIPRGSNFLLSRRNAEMLAQFDGTTASMRALCDEHRITEQRFYQILRASRAQSA